jgi:prepilin-type N-terminal cleavage/methylation domain-containing protein
MNIDQMNIDQGNGNTPLGRYRLVALRAIWTNYWSAGIQLDPPQKGLMVSSKQHGFSLLEMMIVLALMLTVATISLISLQPILQQSHVTSAYDTTLMAVRNYHDLAITQRKRYIVTMTAPGTITVSRWDFALPASPPPVVVNTLTLPQDVTFSTQAGYPATAATVPDGFGAGAVALDFDQGMGLGSQNYVMFMPDGSSQDNLGNLNSGVLYMGRANDLYSSRAITVFGATGRIRGWRLYQVAGVNTWVQQ